MSQELLSPLRPLPPAFPATVAALHRIAEQVVSPARKPDNEIALVATPGGFGTPVFDDGGVRRQVRVDGTDLVYSASSEERRTSLDVDPLSASRLVDWYAFGEAILELLVKFAAAEDAPTPVLLWPEHFDIAIELGAEHAGRRANCVLARRRAAR